MGRASAGRPTGGFLVRELDRLHTKSINLLSPVGIRFMQGSDQLLAQQSGRATCTFELPTPVGAHADGGSPDDDKSWPYIAEMLSALEKVLVDGFDGRPHWGQSFWTAPDVLQKRYAKDDRWKKWKAVRRRFDPLGVFSNAFSERLGL